MRSGLAASVVIVCGAAAVHAPGEPPTFVDGTDRIGLGGINSARVCLADLDGDGRPDAVIRGREAGNADRYRVFLNKAGEDGLGARFIELEKPSGLPAPRDGDCLVFADLDNDGDADAVFTRYLDVNNEQFAEPAEEPKRTAWMPGNGDGTFGGPRVIEAAQRATTACVAVGDVDRDGLLDLYLGHWYTKYGASNDGFTNDLLHQRRGDGGAPNWEREQLEWSREDIATLEREQAEEEMPIVVVGLDEDADPCGRPTYGALIAELLWGKRPELLELNYGRRWNRLWLQSKYHLRMLAPAAGLAEAGTPVDAWSDMAPVLGIDGDGIRHGRYPDWLKEVAQRDPRFARADEEPFRSNGNTFDAAIGDIDNDGDFDLFLAEITHAWAGESSDRSRFLVQSSEPDELPYFDSLRELSVDRIPPTPPPEARPEGWRPRWNQGDLFCELADLDHDGRLDLILSSGDYPDPPPYDQRLRIFHQQEDGTFSDVTAASGIDHPGSQQISLGDVDLDGDLDILVGQSFNRFTKEMIEARTPPGPVARVFLNQTVERRAAAGQGPGSLVLRLVGDASKGVNRDALGAVVEVVTRADGKEVRQLRQLIGIGGHAGKQHEFIVHVGLGKADAAERVEVRWPGAETPPTLLENVGAGRRTVRFGADAAGEP